MHFDIAHALVAAALVILTVWALRRAGIITEESKHQWNWRLFGAIFVVMFIFNILWPDRY